MLIDVKVPVFSESITEGTLLKWHKARGDFVRRDEVLVEIETDKVVLEVTAPDNGVLSDIKCADGSTVTSEKVIASIDTEAKASMQSAREPAKPAPGATPEAAAAAAKLSPSVRKMLQENDLQAGTVPASGKGGRLTKADVVAYLDKVETPAASASFAPAPSQNGRPEQRVAMTRLRARIAERLKDAQNTAAILTTFNEVNMKPVMDLRGRYKDQFEREHGIKLGFMSFFTKACVEALKKYPVINASIDGTDIIYHGYYDVSIAVSSPRGLVVPVIRNADSLTLAEIEKQIADYSAKAKEGKLTIEDLTGGTFTISNGGVFGSLLSTPILNPPQSAILGMHKTQERPVVENGQIVARPMMYLALSYDHRIIDGHEAVLFLVKVKELIEDPARLLLQI